MAHPEQINFCSSVKDKLESHFIKKLVIDIGSLDINGSNQYLFEDCLYLGIDVAEGKNVDFVTPGHQLMLPNESVDTIISTECFEHDQFYENTLKNIIRMLKPNGLFIFTCATTGRPEHGTRKTTPHDAPLLQSLEDWSDYYKNLTEEDIRATLDIDSIFETYHFSTNPKTCDLYFYGIKKGSQITRSNYSFLVSEKKIQHKKELATLKSNLAANERQIAKLESSVAAAHQEIDDIHATLSWCITAPLRGAKKAIKKFYSLTVKILFALLYLLRNPAVIGVFFTRIRKFGLRHTLRKTLSFISMGQAQFRLANTQSFNIRKNVQLTYILTTPHCHYIAQSISAALSKLEITSEIIYTTPDGGYANAPHFVICPQMFHSLPDLYVAIQLEQSVSSRWFTPDYFKMLENSFAVLDYSITNIDFLQKNGLSMKHIHYLPIGYIPDNSSPISSSEDPSEGYDVIFYGDINNKRRKEFIAKIEQNFRVKVINNLFGEELYKELSRARIVINIHYYKDALLETTRIWECLSLNKLVISEKSGDMDQHDELLDIVDFIDVDDSKGMVDRIVYWLNNETLRVQKIEENRQKLQERPNKFDYFFYRFLLATDNINFDEFWNLTGNKVQLTNNKLCLTLPESTERTLDFIRDNSQFGFSIFPGLRHSKGWIGCAMSYKLMIKLAEQQKFSSVTICEDDVEFPENFQEHLQSLNTYLANHSADWDLFSGLLADLSDDTQITGVDYSGNTTYVTINKMISTVFNIYHSNVFEKIASWDADNHDVQTNTIDRYLESNDLNVLTTFPFLVGHKEEQHSTIWGFKNTQYNELISRSEALLGSKVTLFLEQHAKTP